MSRYSDHRLPPDDRGRYISTQEYEELRKIVKERAEDPGERLVAKERKLQDIRDQLELTSRQLRRINTYARLTVLLGVLGVAFTLAAAVTVFGGFALALGIGALFAAGITGGTWGFQRYEFGDTHDQVELAVRKAERELFS